MTTKLSGSLSIPTGEYIFTFKNLCDFFQFLQSWFNTAYWVLVHFKSLRPTAQWQLPTQCYLLSVTLLGQQAWVYTWFIDGGDVVGIFWSWCSCWYLSKFVEPHVFTPTRISILRWDLLVYENLVEGVGMCGTGVGRLLFFSPHFYYF